LPAYAVIKAVLRKLRTALVIYLNSSTFLTWKDRLLFARVMKVAVVIWAYILRFDGWQEQAF